MFHVFIVVLILYLGRRYGYYIQLFAQFKSKVRLFFCEVYFELWDLTFVKLTSFWLHIVYR